MSGRSVTTVSCNMRDFIGPVAGVWAAIGCSAASARTQKTPSVKRIEGAGKRNAIS